MNKNEALKMAEEALDEYPVMTGKLRVALQACKEALEQPAQEPVEKYMQPIKPLVTAPSITISNTTSHPASSWQGLSDDEILKFVSSVEEIKPQYGMMLSNEWNILDFARAIEQALKEKNNV